jgi:formylmethanofuran dehydrogenase subunit B
METATLDGKAIALGDAYKHAAKILKEAAFPLVAGLGADVAGARAAILLAERLKGAFDHLASRETLADIDVKRSFGMFTTTANEARLRGDCVVLIGPGLTRAWPGMLERLALAEPRRGRGTATAQGDLAGPGVKRTPSAQRSFRLCAGTFQRAGGVAPASADGRGAGR